MPIKNWKLPLQLMATFLHYAVIAFIVLTWLLNRWLERLNAKNRRSALPPEVQGIYDEEKYRKSLEYDAAKASLSGWASGLSLLVLVPLLWVDAFAWLDAVVRTLGPDPVMQALVFFGVLFFAADLLGLPFSVYATFVIEEKFGFNRTSVVTFILDRVKGYLMALVIGGGLMAIVVKLYLMAGNLFWLYTWGTVTFVMILMTMFYTSWIVPLFNKLAPLPEGGLRTEIEKYCTRVGFPLKKILVMNGSKRSSKANAYFSGLGGRKSIVLFDTLVEGNSTGELVSVIAHEVGHYRKKHVLKGFLLSSLHMGILIYIFSLSAGSEVIAGALGAQETSFHIGLLGFSLLYSPLSLLTGIFMNIFSRRNEFEADAFACQTTGKSDLASALKKLSVNHLSNLNPHPWYVFFNYSHPPLLQRLKAISVKVDR